MSLFIFDKVTTARQRYNHKIYLCIRKSCGGHIRFHCYVVTFKIQTKEKNVFKIFRIMPQINFRRMKNTIYNGKNQLFCTIQPKLKT